MHSAPHFDLPDTVSGSSVRLAGSEATATVVAFICNHCPYVVHIADQFVNVAKELQSKGVRVIAISSNDVDKYPMDGPEQMKEFAESYGFTFPYLYDESQEIARAYDAVCTPDLFVLDADLNITYHGRFDASSPGNGKPLTGDDLRAAVDATMANNAGSIQQIPSIGCSIKWK